MTARRYFPTSPDSFLPKTRSMIFAALCAAAILLCAALVALPAHAWADDGATTEANASVQNVELLAPSDVDTVSIERGVDYDKAFACLELINEQRTAAGASALHMDKGLLDAAMLRAEETIALFDHTRPDGTAYTTVSPLVADECIAYGNSLFGAYQALSAWMDDQTDRNAILGEQYGLAGIGCVSYGNAEGAGAATYWVICLGTGTASTDCPKPENTSGTISLNLAPDLFTNQGMTRFEREDGTAVFCDSGECFATTLYIINPGNQMRLYPRLDTVNFSSENPSVATIDTLGTVTCIGSGITSVKANLGSSDLDLIVRVGIWTRLFGESRYGTMAAIVDESIPDGSADRIFVATGESYADALTSSALAGAWNAPLIITGKNSLGTDAASEISRIANGSADVYILGGTGAVSAAVESSLKKQPGVGTVYRSIQGDSRIETGLRIFEAGAAENLWGDTCIITNAWNYADALSASPYAWSNNAPLFGTTNGVLTPEQVSAICDYGFTHIVILGGDAAVDMSAVQEALTAGGLECTYLRLAGDSRLQTSAQIVKWCLGDLTDAPFQPDSPLSPDGMGVATANNFPDALCSVNLLGPTCAPLLLVSDSEASAETISNIIGEHNLQISHGWIFGGTNAVPEVIRNRCELASRG